MKTTDPTLTPREQEVITLLSQGLSTKQIASELGIRYATADAHRNNIMHKAGTHDAISLIMHAIKKGWIECPTVTS